MIAGLALAAVVAVSVFLFARRVWLLARLVRMGKPPGIARDDRVPDRLRQEAVVVLGQRKLLDRLVPGMMHAFIFWAFIVLFPAIPLAMIAIVGDDVAPRWYETLANVFAVLALIGYLTIDELPTGIVSFTPHLATLLVLSLASQRLRPPKADGLVYRRGEH